MASLWQTAQKAGAPTSPHATAGPWYMFLHYESHVDAAMACSAITRSIESPK